VENHRFGLGLWCDGCGEAGVQQEVVLGCPCLSVDVGGSVILDFLEHDLSIVHKQRMGRSTLYCHVNWDVKNILPAVDHSLLSQGGEEKLEPVWLQGEELPCQGLDCPLQSLIPLAVA